MVTTDEVCQSAAGFRQTLSRSDLIGAQTQSQCDGKIEKNMFRARGLPPVKYDTRIRPDTVAGPNPKTPANPILHPHLHPNRRPRAPELVGVIAMFYMLMASAVMLR